MYTAVVIVKHKFSCRAQLLLAHPFALHDLLSPGFRSFHFSVSVSFTSLPSPQDTGTLHQHFIEECFMRLQSLLEPAEETTPSQ